MSTNADVPRRPRHLGKKLLFSIIVGFLFFFIIEGICNTIIVFRDLGQKPLIAERKHTEYDTELGWINIPRVSIPNLYGPNRHLTINSQRFRGKEEYSQQVPEDRIRVICSGDSFTLGYMVDDDATWCAVLEDIEPRFQTINMGQGGYGMDQAYLWYEREKNSFEHQVHILAFIGEDFRRIPTTNFAGYGKPVLKVDDQGNLLTTNVPVPKVAYLAERVMRNAIHLQQLSSVRVLRRLVFEKEYVPSESEVEAEATKVAAAIFRKLRDWHTEHGSTLILVYLPVDSEYRKEANVYRKFVHEFATRERLNFIDLCEPMNALEIDDMMGMYEGHFSTLGNRFIAENLHRRMLEIPAIATALESKRSH